MVSTIGAHKFKNEPLHVYFTRIVTKDKACNLTEQLFAIRPF